MGQRGPKSAAQLAVTTPAKADATARPDACYSLPDEAAEVWHATLAALPADWIGHESLPVLAAYCRVTVHLRRLGQLIHQAESGPDPLDLPTYLTMIKAHGAASQTLKTLATSLRLTPQSRYRAETAARTIDGKRPGPRPWEY